MRYTNKTLMEMRHKISMTSEIAQGQCKIVEVHGTDEYAKTAVAKYRGISKDIRRDLMELLADLAVYDLRVEKLSKL